MSVKDILKKLDNKDYEFVGPDGRESLADLFGGKRQLLVYHFMFGPDWEEGCPSCSFWADSYNGIDIHLAHRDTTLIAVSNTSLDKINAYKERMGWSFKWVSSLGTEFNRASFRESERGMRLSYAPRASVPMLAKKVD